MGDRSDGIDRTNRDFVRYDQVEKRQAYRLSEKDGSEAYDENYHVRTCDMRLYLAGDSRDKRRFASQLGEALGEIGFAILENTGIDAGLYDEAAERTAALFAEHTIDEKMRFRARRHGSVNQGYFPIKETTDIHPDLVEGWVFCRRAFDLDPSRPCPVERFWPNREHESFFRRLWLQHERLVLPVMRSLLTYLGQQPTLYDDRLSGTNFALRLNYYPPVSPADAQTGGGRLLGHEDVDLFTLLPAPQIEGLQLLNRRNFKWIRLSAPRGTVILNTGDYMQRITNDILPSTTHRVAKPRDPRALAEPRVSFPINIYLWENELLEVLPGLGEPKYEPIRAETFHIRATSKYYGDDYAATP